MQKTIYMLLETTFPPDMRVMNEAETLTEAGYKVVVFALNFTNLPVQEKLENDVWVVRKKINHKLFNKIHTTVRLFPFYRYWWKRFITSFSMKPDVLHVHDLPLAQVGWEVARFYRVPFVLDLHENYPAALNIWTYSRSFPGRWLYPRNKWKKYELEAVQKADRVILVTLESMDRFIDRGFEKGKFEIISNFPNLKIMKNISTNSDKTDKFKNRFNVVYAGGFGPHRGLEIALEAIPYIKNAIPNIMFWVVGDGKERSVLERRVGHLNIKDNVCFTGFLPFNEMSKIIAQSDIALLPHIKTEHTETTIPHKLFHYMYWEKPIVASDCTPIKRIITQTNTGRVYPNRNPVALADTVTFLKNHPDTVAKEGKIHILKEYNWKIEAQKLVKLYEFLATNSTK